MCPVLNIGGSGDVVACEVLADPRTVALKRSVVLPTDQSVEKIKVTPEDNPTSQSLKSAGDTNVANLKTLKGVAFDKAYIDNEVAFHQQVLDAVDKTLIPGASNEELKALLVKARPMFVDHIDQARKLQASVSKATS